MTQFQHEPTADDRRRAVCAALGSAPGLVRYAARYTKSLDDAEDAYQRAMEIALTEAPVTESRPFIKWLMVVVRNEAIRLHDARHREMPMSQDEIAEGFTRLGPSGQAIGPEAVIEWRERYRAVQDALIGLTESERVCLMLSSAGVTRQEIEHLTGFSERKINRSIADARDRLRRFELRLESGEECARLSPLIERVVDDTATARQRRRVARHVRHCRACRVAYRTRQEQVQLLASLVPGALVANDLVQSRAADPTFAVHWWERLSGGTTVRTGQVVQAMIDLPTLASSRAGAGALAAAAATAIGAPAVVNHVRSEPAPATPIVREAVAGPRPSPPVRTAKVATRPTPPSRATRVRRPSSRVSPAPRRRRSNTAPSRQTSSVRRTPPVLTARTSQRSSTALEFGP